MKHATRICAFMLCSLLAIALVAGCAATPTKESTGEYIDDAATTAKVKARLLQDPDVSGLKVGVETFKGRVQLSGFVDTQVQKTKAQQLAANVPGVRSVENDLIVKPR